MKHLIQVSGTALVAADSAPCFAMIKMPTYGAWSFDEE
jgi:hypothetical protein